MKCLCKNYNWSETTVGPRSIEIIRVGRISLVLVFRDGLSELGVVEGVGLLEAGGGVVHGEGPHVQDPEVLVLVGVVESVGFSRPLLGL